MKHKSHYYDVIIKCVVYIGQHFLQRQHQRVRCLLAWRTLPQYQPGFVPCFCSRQSWLVKKYASPTQGGMFILRKLVGPLGIPFNGARLSVSLRKINVHVHDAEFIYHKTALVAFGLYFDLLNLYYR